MNATKTTKTTVRFDSGKYVWAHGSMPKGRGSWVFEDTSWQTTGRREQWWAEGNCTLSEAKNLVSGLIKADPRYAGKLVILSVCS